MMRKLLLSLILLYCPFIILAQSLITDFGIENSGCIGQKFRITNYSSGAQDQEWDFCEGDLLSLPDYSLNSFSLFQAVSPIDLRIKNDNGEWFTFVCDGDANRIIRLSYGSSLSNLPTQTIIGNFQIPTGIDLYKHQNNWYGLVGTFLTPTRLYLLEFGSSLSNNPVIKQVNIGDSDIIKSRSIRIVQQGNELVAFVANWEQSQITRIVFGTNFTINPIVVDHVSLGSSSLIGLDVTETPDGKKILFSTSYVNTIYSVDFSQDWKSTPVVNSINTGATVIINPTMLDVEFEGGNYYIMLMTNNGTLYRMNMGSSALGLTPLITPFTSLGSINNVRGFDLVREGGHYTALLSSFSDIKLSKISFNSNCVASIAATSLFNPQDISFAGPGTFPVTLRNHDSSIFPKFKTVSVSVSSNASPNFSFTTLQKCINTANTFTLTSDVPLTIFDWKFGDGVISSLSNPSHQYAVSGTYAITLVASASNGCSNYFQQSVKIYSPPVSSFTSPPGLICTNNQFDFVNNTTDNFDGNLTYQWLINNQQVATSRDLAYSFTTTGDQTVKLVASIPGCSSEATQVINNVQSGPTVGFATSGKCQDETVSFTNTSSGNISSYSWNLGNNESINQTNTSKTFSNPGTYTISLEAQGVNGCISKSSKILSIYSKPQTNFSLDLPPFSCSGSPSQFNDVTPSMTDSNIASWQWNFGDNVNNTATTKNPTHVYSTAGAYPVSLMTTTNFGCSNSIQKTVTISPSPVASFTNGIACLNQNLQFVNSSASIKSSSWTINNQTFTTLNPPLQRFVTPGAYDVRLTVTGNNNCQNTTTKTIQIKSPPLVDFSVEAPCTGNPTRLSNISVGGNDVLSSIQWDLGDTQPTGSTVNYTFTNAGIYGVRMIYNGQSGCSYPVSKNVSIAEGPIARFAPSDDVGAAPLIVNFLNNSTPSNLQSIWSFKKDLTLLSQSSLQNPSFTFSELGDYSATLRVTNSLNCYNELSIPIRVVVPKISAMLTDFKLIDATGGAKQALIMFENTSNVSITDPEVVLDISGGPMIKEKVIGKFKPGQMVTSTLNATLLPRGLNYACAEIVVNEDANSDDNKKCLSLQDEPVLFTPFPNPVASEFQFEWISSTTDQAEVWVYSSSGQIAFHQSWPVIQSGLNKLSINAADANLTDGLFYFTFQQGPIKKTFRFMVTKE